MTGWYSAMGPIVKKAIERLQRMEDKWRLQEDKALEALQWCEILNDNEGMDRLCAIFERTGGMESPTIHKKLSAVFNDAAASPDRDVLRLRALTCLNRTDWSGATEPRFDFGSPRPPAAPQPALDIDQLLLALQSPQEALRHAAAQTLLTLGSRPETASMARGVFNIVDATTALPAEIRKDARRHAETLHVSQLTRLQMLVVGLEKDTYFPRLRMG